MCRCRVAFLRNDVGEDGSVGPARVWTWTATDSALPGGAGLVGISDPDIMPASAAELVQALAIVQGRSLTLELAPARFAAPQVAMQGVEAR